MLGNIVVDCTVLDHISEFEYLGYNVAYITSNVMVNKLHKTNFICRTIRRTLKSTSKETRLEFYMAMALLPPLYGCKDF